jgi:hypothetical protein
MRKSLLGKNTEKKSNSVSMNCQKEKNTYASFFFNFIQKSNLSNDKWPKTWPSQNPWLITKKKLSLIELQKKIQFDSILKISIPVICISNSFLTLSRENCKCFEFSSFCSFFCYKKINGLLLAHKKKKKEIFYNLIEYYPKEGISLSKNKNKKTMWLLNKNRQFFGEKKKQTKLNRSELESKHSFKVPNDNSQMQNWL